MSELHKLLRQRRPTTQQTQQAKDALLFAASEVRTASGHDFLESCVRQFEEKGFLTTKQINALFSIDSKRVSGSYSLNPILDEFENEDFPGWGDVDPFDI